MTFSWKMQISVDSRAGILYNVYHAVLRHPTCQLRPPGTSPLPAVEYVRQPCSAAGSYKMEVSCNVPYLSAQEAPALQGARLPQENGHQQRP